MRSIISSHFENANTPEVFIVWGAAENKNEISLEPRRAYTGIYQYTMRVLLKVEYRDM